MGSTPKPWEYARVPALLVSAYDTIDSPRRAQRIREVGVRRYLGYKGLVMLDSGGFSLLRDGRTDFEAILTFLEGLYVAARPTVAVSLDLPSSPDTRRRDRAMKWRKTLSFLETLNANVIGAQIMPVVHGKDCQAIERACQDVAERVGKPMFIGVGGLVPIIRRVPRSTGRAGLGPVREVMHMVHTVRSYFPESCLHVFGAGGTILGALLAMIGADSFDSIGWRVKAGYGKIQLEGMSDQYVRRLWSDFAEERAGGPRVRTWRRLSQCRCRACRGLNTKQRLRTLATSFSSRAIHNSWTTLREWRAAISAMRREDPEGVVSGRALSPEWRKHMEYARNLRS